MPDIKFTHTKEQGDIPMKKANRYLEKVDAELLDKHPDNLPFCNIRTDYDDLTILGREAARERQKNKKRASSSHASKTLKRIAITVCILIFLSFSAVSGACIYLLQDYQPTGSLFDRQMISSVNSTGLLLMMDFNKEAADGSDDAYSLMLLSASPFSGKLNITVFPENTVIQSPDGSESSLGEYYFNGKYDEAAQMLCETYGIRANGYIKISEPVFTDFVNTIGGIRLPAPDATVVNDLRDEGFVVKESETIPANGQLVSAYCRIIKGQNELFRAERQVNVMKDIIMKLRYTNPLHMLKTMKNILSESESDLSRTRFCELAFAIAFRTNNIDCIINGQ